MAKSPLLRSLLWVHRQVIGARHTGMPVTEFAPYATEMRQRRRDFLKNAAGAVALGAGLAALPTSAHAVTPTCRRRSSVAIIGGGMAGLNCAWELKQKGVRATIYEAAKRVTGRIITDRSTFAAQGMFCDLGGEYIDTGHTTMRAIARRYHLPLLDYRDDAEQIENYFDFGGQRRTVQQVLTAYEPIAETIDAAYEEFEDPDGTVTFDNHNGGERLDSLSIRAFLAPIAAPGWIKKLLEVAYTQEFGLDADVNNCINLIYMISTEVKKMKQRGEFDLFGISDERFHCKLGNDAIPRALADDLAPGQITLERKLTAVRSCADGRYVLTFACGPEVIARHVVFALPFTMLRTVDLSGVSLPDWKLNAINHNSYGMVSKIFTGHTRPIWREQGFIGNALSDQPFQSTTETNRMQEGTTGILENYTGGTRALQVAQGTTAQQVSTFHDQVERLFPGLKASYNGRKIRVAWSEYPFTRAAYSSYSVGDYTTIAGAEPIRVGNLHFCGEHTTIDFQGWMEGAARTGADVAVEVGADLGVCPPAIRTNQRLRTATANA